jgi:glutamate---cysteine ligase / carboxylate-amine ligase
MGTPVDERETLAQAQWAEWTASARPYTIGVEEEVMLLDPRDWALAQRIEDVLAALPAALAG